MNEIWIHDLPRTRKAFSQILSTLAGHDAHTEIIPSGIVSRTNSTNSPINIRLLRTPGS